MLAFFRRLSKSTVGTIIMALFLILILVGFAMGDIQSIIQGGGFGGSSDTLAKVGSERVTDREISRAMERRLSEVRRENPQADYSTIARDFDLILNALIDAKALEAFADKFGFVISKKLVDAQIAQIPATRGLNGQFSEAAYQSFLAQQRLTDEEVRMAIRSDLLQQLIITPVAAGGRSSVGMATPYASMLLEARQGEVAFIPLAELRKGLNPTPADLQRYYSENRNRYMVPEQRVLRLAKIGPEQVANVQPSEQEITQYYNANQALYAPKDIRVISQAVVPDQATAQAIANRARGGQSFAAAAAPAGLSAADISVGPQTKQQFTELAGAQVANAAFGAAEGAIVGPVRSDLGWHVVKIDEVRREGGKPLSAVRSEIAAKLTADKRKEAIEALVTRVQDAIDDGASFSEAAAAAKLQPVETPPVTAAGTSVSNPAYKPSPEVAAVLKTGFELGEGDEPLIEQLPKEGGYVLVAPARIIPAAPAPLAEVQDRVRQDWINAQATKRAQQIGQAIVAKAARAPLTEAAKGSPVQVPVQPVRGRRIQLAQYQGRIPPALRMLFSLGAGKARMVAGSQGEGFYVVKLDKITPGNAITAPGLIGQMQQQLQQALGQEYGLQFLNAIRQTVGVKRNEEAIAATKRRITAGSAGS
jgi:peptidyl-prolyl cis-trans isomerase D